MPDSDKRSEPRVYGQADDSNRNPPPPEGMRGEGSASGADHPEYAHEETAAGGRRVVVEEVNGVAFAEGTGRAGLEAQREHDRKAEKDGG